MQFLRTIVWRAVGIAFVGLLITAASPALLGGTIGISRLSHQTMIAGYISFALGFVMPIRFLRIPSTLIHEVGHALMSSLLGGKVKSIRVEIDESGVTWSRYKTSRLRIFLVSVSGPLANAVFLYFTVGLIAHNLATYWIGFTLISVALITLTTVRSFWGWLVAIFVSFILVESLIKSLQISSASDTFSGIGIWTQSSINLAVIFAMYTAAIELKYAWAVRQPRSSGQDEYKAGRALGISPSGGGHLILTANVLLVALAISQALGWANLWTPGSFF